MKENKEKIVLKDGTEIEIENGAAENKIQVIVSDLDAFKQTYQTFSEQNLALYQIEDSDGSVFATYTEKCVDGVNLKSIPEGFLVTFHIADVDKIQKAVDAAIDAYTEQLIEEGLI